MCDKRPMELRDTVEMMNSEDYKERFRAEYCQTVIRYGKLKNMLDRWDDGNMNFFADMPEKHIQYADQGNDRLHCGT